MKIQHITSSMMNHNPDQICMILNQIIDKLNEED